MYCGQNYSDSCIIDNTFNCIDPLSPCYDQSFEPTLQPTIEPTFDFPPTLEPTLQPTIEPTLTLNMSHSQTLSTMNEYEDFDEYEYDTTYIDSIEIPDAAVTSNNNVGIIVGATLGCISYVIIVFLFEMLHPTEYEKR